MPFTDPTGGLVFMLALARAQLAELERLASAPNARGVWAEAAVHQRAVVARLDQESLVPAGPSCG